MKHSITAMITILLILGCKEVPFEGDPTLGTDPGNEQGDTNPSEGSEGGNSSDSQENAECSQLTVNECNGRTDCTTIVARKGDIQNQCTESATEIGCMEAGLGCDEAITYAYDSNNDCWVFSNGCIPAQWTLAENDDPCGYSSFEDENSCDDVPPSAECSDLNPSECNAAPNCRVISGRQIHSTDNCLMDFEDVGCMISDGGCGDAETWATDPNGGCWWFSDTCLPVGWTDTSGTNSECTGENHPDIVPCE